MKTSLTKENVINFACDVLGWDAEECEESTMKELIIDIVDCQYSTEDIRKFI